MLSIFFYLNYLMESDFKNVVKKFLRLLTLKCSPTPSKNITSNFLQVNNTSCKYYILYYCSGLVDFEQTASTAVRTKRTLRVSSSTNVRF